MEFAGEFETHITVGLADERRIDALRECGEHLGLKCLHILLERGKAISQPMLTRRGAGVLSDELALARGLCQALDSHGFSVTRIKIEAACSNQGIPQTDGDAALRCFDCYFEHHVKLLLGRQADIKPLIALVQQHAAHVSRNSLRLRTDNLQERFVTQRFASTGRSAARRKLQALLDVLADHEYEVIDVEEEFVVYDSNTDLDAGWIESEGAAHV